MMKWEMQGKGNRSKKPYENGKVIKQCKRKGYKKMQVSFSSLILSASIILKPAFQMDSSLAQSKLITVLGLICLVFILRVIVGKLLLKEGTHLRVVLIKSFYVRGGSHLRGALFRGKTV